MGTFWPSNTISLLSGPKIVSYISLREFWKFGINKNSEIQDFFWGKKVKIRTFSGENIVKFHKNSKIWEIFGIKKVKFGTFLEGTL